jgi:hypothetical protein
VTAAVPGMTVSAVKLEGTWTVRPLVIASPVEVLTFVRVAAPAALCGEYAHTYVAFTCGRKVHSMSACLQTSAALPLAIFSTLGGYDLPSNRSLRPTGCSIHNAKRLMHYALERLVAACRADLDIGGEAGGQRYGMGALAVHRPRGAAPRDRRLHHARFPRLSRCWS